MTADDRPHRYAYLGPRGTFTEAALLTLPGAAEGDHLPLATVPAVLEALRSGEADTAVVALENSVEGSVPTTLDELATGEPLHIVGEIHLPVSFALLVRPGTTLADIKTVASHPIAQPQCRHWLLGNVPDAEWRAATSNAEAAQHVADGHYDAALAGSFAASRYGLTVLADDIHDVADAVTRFVVLHRPCPPPTPTGMDRTTIVAFIGEDHPGALLEILTEFSVRGINLTLIQSRPTGAGLGSYLFWMDFEGHVADARVAEALMALRRICSDVRFVGSYPRADRVRPEIRRGTHDNDFTEAAAWLQSIRTGHQ
ncbi:prephenate dehydratase [Actinomadura pelletieri DSM 43383]|uniref:Prephenate dehydratase n=1 Tax=Actinomadura pelletieri DSM 43383 TaxID=1120940 RepID=A0A495QZP5_9ACTN|nr:prephenate dehydratase [Actinomadura pelletieri]RKS79424.1 prephenate dehydratase [Actinomadura pelletieri DSM 43383]